ncbi:unnamed protein product [Parajaminaea phylloscopi]
MCSTHTRPDTLARRRLTPVALGRCPRRELSSLVAAAKAGLDFFLDPPGQGKERLQRFRNDGPRNIDKRRDHCDHCPLVSLRSQLPLSDRDRPTHHRPPRAAPPCASPPPPLRPAAPCTSLSDTLPSGLSEKRTHGRH